MHPTKLTKYALYLEEKANIKLIETDYGFVTYSIGENSIFIHDMFIQKEFRNEGYGSQLLNAIEIIAKDNEINYLRCNVLINSNGFQDALLAQIHKGFKIISANNDVISLIKEIVWEA